MKRHILFIHNGLNTFVRGDMEILSGLHKIEVFEYQSSRSAITNLKQQLRLSFWLVTHIWRARMVYVWFSDYHSLLPVLIARLRMIPVYIVAGGYDANCIPWLRYGAMCLPLRRWFAKSAFRLADSVLAVSHFTATLVRKRVPNARIQVIHNQFEVQPPNGIERRKMRIVTAASMETRGRFYIKGLDLVLRTACQMQDLEFIIAGIERQQVPRWLQIPDNVTFLPRMPQDELWRLFSSASVYVQFSRTESFGLAAAEATMCGCVPVLTPVGALPEVFDDIGVFAASCTVEACAGAIRESMASKPVADGLRPFSERFSRQKRLEALRRLPGIAPPPQ